MAALVARAALGNGLAVEVYEEGDMWLIESSGKRQEIKLTGEAPANLLKFLTMNQDLLRPASANSDKDARLAELEATYGPLYPRSQHKPGEMIRYQIEGLRYRGEVLWVQAPGEQGGRHLPMRNFVQCEEAVYCGKLSEFVEVVFATDLVREPA